MTMKKMDEDKDGKVSFADFEVNIAIVFANTFVVVIAVVLIIIIINNKKQQLKKAKASNNNKHPLFSLIGNATLQVTVKNEPLMLEAFGPCLPTLKVELLYLCYCLPFPSQVPQLS